jgi:hypothetical protein
LAPHPDYAISTKESSGGASIGPANPSPAGPVRVVREQRADQVSRAAPPRAPEFQKRTSGGLTRVATLLDRWAGNGGAPKLPGPSPAISTVQGGDHPASAGERDALRPGGPESSPVEPRPVQPLRPSVCPYPRHEPTWVQRWDGTWRCGTCHP